MSCQPAGSFLFHHSILVLLTTFHQLGHRKSDPRFPSHRCLLNILFIILSILFFQDFIYLFLDRGEGWERGRETSMCGCLLCALYWGPGPQPRHVPWLGIEPAIFWFKGRHSVHWATPARAILSIIIKSNMHCFTFEVLTAHNGTFINILKAHCNSIH